MVVLSRARGVPSQRGELDGGRFQRKRRRSAPEVKKDADSGKVNSAQIALVWKRVGVVNSIGSVEDDLDGCVGDLV